MSRESYNGKERAYFTVDKDGTEKIHSSRPSKVGGIWIGVGRWNILPPGSIHKLKGSEHSWDDGVYLEEWEPIFYC